MATKSETKLPESKSETKSDSKSNVVRDKNLELALQAIAKEYGDGSIMRLGGRSLKTLHRGHSHRLDRDRHGAGRRRFPARAYH